MLEKKSALLRNVYGWNNQFRGFLYHVVSVNAEVFFRQIVTFWTVSYLFVDSIRRWTFTTSLLNREKNEISLFREFYFFNYEYFSFFFSIREEPNLKLYILVVIINSTFFYSLNLKNSDVSSSIVLL